VQRLQDAPDQRLADAIVINAAAIQLSFLHSGSSSNVTTLGDRSVNWIKPAPA
jgi:hypothetical protein